MTDRIFECLSCGEPTTDVHEILRKSDGVFARFALPCHSRWSIKGTTDGCEETLAARLSDDRLWPAIVALNDATWLVANASGEVEVDQTTDELRAELAALAAGLEHDERPVGGPPTPASLNVVFAPLGMTAQGADDGFRAQARALAKGFVDAAESAMAANADLSYAPTLSDATFESVKDAASVAAVAINKRDAALRALLDFCLKEP